jgi:cyanate lyase
MTRDEITAEVVAARIERGLSWQSLAEAIAKPVVWATAALLGQHPLARDDANIIVDLLGLPASAAAVLATVPYRGSLPTAVPSDPTIYRFYEALQVYGSALKELIHEQFGDGIMSAINFKLELGTAQHDGADHVVVTFDGKFLPYSWPTS